MYRNLRWKLIVILTLVIGTSAFAWVPPLADRMGLPLPAFMAERRLSLGLDLKGGEGFAFTLLVGIVAGTWSTVFVAAPVAAPLARRP